MLLGKVAAMLVVLVTKTFRSDYLDLGADM